MTHLVEVSIDGIRGYGHRQNLRLAVPNGKNGSGITVICGANNSGKSTIVEALRAMSRRESSSFSVGKRNILTGRVEIGLTFADGRLNTLATVPDGGSETEWKIRQVDVSELNLSVVQSRRGFEPFFSRAYPTDRQKYNVEASDHNYRPQALDHTFSSRLFKLQEDPQAKSEFQDLLRRVLGYDQNWMVDKSDSGMHYINILIDGVGGGHSSEGVGEGIVSLFAIIDALYSSPNDSIIVIDEPELSLHPQIQRRLRALLSELAASRQIIYTTHSPYFIDWSDLEAGAEICRTYKKGGYYIELSQPRRVDLKSLFSFGANLYNPHVLGLNASEVFFLEDGVIVTEGQEDVVIFEKMAEDSGLKFNAEFYGWGAGGAENIRKICGLLKGLGFQKVVAIFDGDKADEAKRFEEIFPLYHVAVLPADDIRNKPPRNAVKAKSGLYDLKTGFDETYRDAMVGLTNSLNVYLGE